MFNVTEVKSVVESVPTTLTTAFQDRNGDIILIGTYVNSAFKVIINEENVDIISHSDSDFYDLAKDLRRFGPVYLNTVRHF